MTNWQLLEEIRVLVFVPARDAGVARAVRKAIAGDLLLGPLRAAIRTLTDRRPALRRARVRVSR